MSLFHLLISQPITYKYVSFGNFLVPLIFYNQINWDVISVTCGDWIVNIC